MLNLWISNLSDTEESDQCEDQHIEESSLSSVAGDWDREELIEVISNDDYDYPHTRAPVADFPPGALNSLNYPSQVPVPVVSTEGGSSEFSAPDSMPSARFFYSNPSSSSQRTHRQHNQGNGIQGNAYSRPPARSSRPQIHVQVNLPGSANGPATAVPQNLAQNVPPAMDMSLAGGHQQMDARMKNLRNNPSVGQVHGSVQRADVPMLFHGSSFGDNLTAETGNVNSFYSAFEPEADFLEFHSMYFHLCKFYHNYGHANVPKHGDCFVMGSWVEKLRQRKHIQDLQESGICVAASLDPISKRQTVLLESLGFRWHITSSENSMIVQHLMFVDNATHSQAGQVNAPSTITNPESMSVISNGAMKGLNQTIGCGNPLHQQSNQVQGQANFNIPKLSILQGTTGSMDPILQGTTGSMDPILQGTTGSMDPILQGTTGSMDPISNLNIAPVSNLNTALDLSAYQQKPQLKHKEKKDSSQKKKKNVQHAPPAVEHESISLARQKQREEDIKACEGFYAQQENVTEPKKEAPKGEGVEKKEAKTETHKILVDPNLDTAEHLWKVQFSKLAEYKRIHGDCTVPARFNGDPKLGHWVMTQRRQFNLMKKGKTSSMSVERIKLLNDIGFSWSIRIDPEKMWMLRYEQLQQYRKDFGDCLVPQRFAENPKLGTW